MTHDTTPDVLDPLSVRTRAVRANNMDFGILEAGLTGPLALCLHGFPDSAYTWRYLLPELAGAGFRAVAPFMRGYAPSEVPSDGCYGIGALVVRGGTPPATVYWSSTYYKPLACNPGTDANQCRLKGGSWPYKIPALSCSVNDLV